MATLRSESSFERKSSTTSMTGPNRDVLDLSRISVRSDHELKRLMEKLPDFKIRAEKCPSSPFDHGSLEGDSSMTTTTEDRESPTTPYPFADPVPASMREVDIRELGRVDINWRMLTTARPKNRTEEDIFTRFVQLEKLQYETTKWENDEEILRERRGGSLAAGRHPGAIPRGRSRGGALTGPVGGRGRSSRTAVTETRLQTCRECGEEFCSGSCKKYLYDDHARTLNPPSVDDIFKVSLPSTSRAPVNKQHKAAAKAPPPSIQLNSKSSIGTAADVIGSLDLLVVSGETKRTSIKEPASSKSKSLLSTIKANLRRTAVDDDSQGRAGTGVKTKVSGAAERHGIHKLKRGVTKRR